METMNVWWTAFIWMALALAASLVSVRLALSVALAEILFGVLGGNILHIQPNEWINFLAGLGGILLTFLAGAETDWYALCSEWKGALTLGLLSFLTALVAELLLVRLMMEWTWQASLITGIALAPTSIAIVYTVLMDTGMNRAPLGRRILVACFMSNLAAMLLLGLAFTKPGIWLAVYLAATAVAVCTAPLMSSSFFRRVSAHISQPRTKYLLLLLLFFSSLSDLADTQALLAAYLLGLSLSAVFSVHRESLHQLRALAFAVFTPFYFLRAGAYVQASIFRNSLMVILLLLGIRILSKTAISYLVCRQLKMSHTEATYTSLVMSTGLTFDIIAAVFGLSHGYLSSSQYTLLVAVTIGSALVPTLIAQSFFKPLVKEETLSHSEVQKQVSLAHTEEG
ncbi:MAG: potassium transporter Kef [Armatimonadota bacterium]|nr:MAG: potassium transporter Kef [Armatimonadota bacterium]